jgi:large subunit ribosomal protein L5
MGVGKAGEPLEKAVQVMELITNQKPVRTKTQKRIPAFDIRPGMAIGCKVTLRGKSAIDFLKRALGNFAFGIREHIDLSGMRYDPKLGVYGMNVCVTLEKPGYRVKLRKKRGNVGNPHRLTKEEAMKFAKELGANIE